MSTYRTVFIGLGTNLGERARHLQTALQAMATTPGIWLCGQSALYETPPWGIADQPAFLNMVAKVHTTYAPQALLEVLLTIEREMGRERRVKWGPRLIDLDILAVDHLLLDTHPLKVPHPHIPQRAFVLVPWHELAPEWWLPRFRQTVAELTAQLPARERAGCKPVGKAVLHGLR